MQRLRLALQARHQRRAAEPAALQGYGQQVGQERLSVRVVPLLRTCFDARQVSDAKGVERAAKASMAAHVRALFAERKLDLVVTVGAPATSFAHRYRDSLFSGTPLVITGLDERRVSHDRLTQNDVVVPLRIDLSDPNWCPEMKGGQGPKDLAAVFCANVIHIAPWNVAEGLFAGAGRYLRPDGMLFLYGPFKRDGKHTALSNAVFDTSLR